MGFNSRFKGLIRNIDIKKLIIELLLSVMTHKCGAVSVVNTLLQWYLQVCCIFHLLLACLLCRSEVGQLPLTRIHTQVKECVQMITTIYVTRSVLETTTTTDKHTVCYSTCWYQFSETVSPTLSVTCTFKYKHSSVDQLRFFRITKLCFHIYIFIHVHHS